MQILYIIKSSAPFPLELCQIKKFLINGTEMCINTIYELYSQCLMEEMSDEEDYLKH